MNATLAAVDGICPFFIVSDAKRAAEFYVQALGFEITYLGPDDAPFFAIVQRGCASLMLKAVSPEVGPLPNSARHEWARWDAFVNVPEPDELARELTERGVLSGVSAERTSDGLYGFTVTDADGYVLFFGRPA